ncbi:UDP-N-acetylglucosamine 2-epimerase (non-hydrolyzing) [Pandoraea sputorum]|uniref:non-hydrolyzing UDP-N-acetylglucosamine 2-epimerase n=1 Tax=Pandoraea sputorum TaxID=93222 RepID=UPI001E50E134|nr:UDP-N-acetylglucosamine 2-epimerase (non-hydrolyzing) [Pandoraea sputorum]MCE4061552.1 UDP-N-acetylglucosamine 2-epimerase (non-hydrolyzing) [Pandoraea sputorum]
MSLKIVTIVGARPQFIKAAAVSRVIRRDFAGKIEEVLVHTGQHYDENMSKVFFDELDIPHPKYNLEISGGRHGEMTGQMLAAIEKVLLEESPDWVLIYGDTNSTLAGALAAAKLHIRVAHVEAGLRSFNMRMPEEVNRIVADRVSNLLLCPTPVAVQNLAAEGVRDGVHNVGDVMLDASLFYRELAQGRSTILSDLGLTGDKFVLATCHRAENTDVPERLLGIVDALAAIAREMPVVFPLHPRTRKLLVDLQALSKLENVKVIEPISFLDMVCLEQAAHVIVTDSGGVQKEAYFFGVPCLTARDETEWVETVESGWNCLVGADPKRILEAFASLRKPTAQPAFYGDGAAASLLLNAILAAS